MLVVDIKNFFAFVINKHANYKPFVSGSRSQKKHIIKDTSNQKKGENCDP